MKHLKTKYKQPNTRQDIQLIIVNTNQTNYYNKHMTVLKANTDTKLNRTLQFKACTVVITV